MPFAERLEFWPANYDLVVCAYPASGEDAVLKILPSLSLKLSLAPLEEMKPEKDYDTKADSCSDLNDHVPCICVHTMQLPFWRSRCNPRARYSLVVRKTNKYVFLLLLQ